MHRMLSLRSFKLGYALEYRTGKDYFARSVSKSKTCKVSRLKNSKITQEDA